MGPDMVSVKWSFHAPLRHIQIRHKRKTILAWHWKSKDYDAIMAAWLKCYNENEANYVYLYVAPNEFKKMTHDEFAKEFPECFAPKTLTNIAVSQL